MSHRIGAWALRGGALLAVGGALAQVSPARAADACPNAAIRAQQGVEQLAECRAYEQVSPVDKGGNDVVPGSGAISPRMQVAPDGNALAFPSTGALPGTPGAPQFSYYRSVRGSDPLGWTTQSMTPRMTSAPDGFKNSNSILGISADGTKTVVGTLSALTPDAVEGNGNLYLRDNRSGTYELMAGSSDSRFRSSVIGFGSVFVGGNSDFSHVVFSACVALTPDAYDSGVGGTGRNVYEWTGHQLRLINVPPAGVDQFQESFAGNGRSNAKQPRFVSEDGSRVFFGTWASIGTNTWVRENGTTTRPLAVSQRADLLGEQENAMIEAASADGTKVLLMTSRLLTDEPGDPVSNGSKGLYVYDLDHDTLTNVAVAADPVAAGPVNLDAAALGTSPDLSVVYFMSPTVLAAGGIAGGANLYVARGGQVRLVGTLDTSKDLYRDANGLRAFVGAGGQLAFAARTPLTGYDNASARCESGACQEVFVYDPVEAELSCASCPAAGVQAAGDAAVGGQNDGSSQIDYFGRAVLPDGRVFFDTPQALVNADTNGRMDVYVFDGGAVRQLISSGRGDSDSYFGDASLSGDDVVFTTSQQLVAQDRDGLVDAYDARVGGGLAAQMTHPSGASCDGDACQGPATPWSGGSGAASELFVGAGDEPAARRVVPARIVVSASRSVRGAALSARVKVSGAGTIAVTGAAVRRVSRKVSRAGSYVVRVALTPSGVRALRRRASVRATVRVTFKPRSGRSVSKRVTLTFKRAGRVGGAATKGGRS